MTSSYLIGQVLLGIDTAARRIWSRRPKSLEKAPFPSNIAEGDELGTDKQAIKFFYIAKGSSAELLTQAIIAFEIGYFDKENFKRP